MVGRHFGKAPEFILITIDNGKAVSSDAFPNPGRDKVNVPVMVAGFGPTHIISGAVGTKAKDVFKEKNIIVITGALGSIDTILDRFLKGQLSSKDAICAGENICQKK
jgi:predicted Fe-Mo cluster-binding NifX family protein